MSLKAARCPLSTCARSRPYEALADKTVHCEATAPACQAAWHKTPSSWQRAISARRDLGRGSCRPLLRGSLPHVLRRHELEGPDIRHELEGPDIDGVLSYIIALHEAYLLHLARR